ncbi:MAG: tRNA threonylcarbamoyladenosine dehydratase [Firmicutes bacterium]|nr:tRNA threonylcarbamoyladenosine dehydratase [Bacillota bacterium]
MSFLDRTEMLIGSEAVSRLADAKVLVFGVGGVGGHVCEALVRAGIGEIHIVDGDTVAESNINRQIIATRDNIGQPKVEAMAERIRSINPECRVKGFQMFFLPGETSDSMDFSGYDYVVDAVDTVAAKLEIIEKAKAAGVPVISSMGTGNKLDPTLFRIADISKTSVCPLAKVIRKELRNRGIRDVKVLFSTEEPVRTGVRTPASISFVPSVAGLIIGGEVIKDIIR